MKTSGDYPGDLSWLENSIRNSEGFDYEEVARSLGELSERNELEELRNYFGKTILLTVQYVLSITREELAVLYADSVENESSIQIAKRIKRDPKTVRSRCESAKWEAKNSSLVEFVKERLNYKS